MEQFEQALYEKSEYQYPSMEFIPFIHGYLHQKETRPAVIIVPGGGYKLVAPTEGEPVAKKFYNMGYQAFVLTYTTNISRTTPLGWQPAEDLARAVAHIRRNAEMYRIKKDCLVLCGFSAGAHLCGTLAVHHARSELRQVLHDGETAELLRPDAAVLCYPVITSGEKGHRGSFEALLGKNINETDLDVMSPEKHVTSYVPPIFMWQTMTDEAVPVENSLLFAQSCKNAGILCELHLFPEGKHGMSLADDEWADNQIENAKYTMYQLYDSFKIIASKSPNRLPPTFKNIKLDTFEDFSGTINLIIGNDTKENLKSDKDISKWPELADAFLKRVWR